MRVAIFFLWLCLFLMKGEEYSQAIAPSHTSGYALAQSIQIEQPIASMTTSDARAVIDNTHRDHPNEYFIIADDVEDDDTNDSSARKFKWLNRCYSTQFCQTITGYPINCSKSAPSFYGRVYYKYILQRVLRV